MENTLVLSPRGEEFKCWGVSSNGRLGNERGGGPTFIPTDVLDVTGLGHLRDIVQVSAGQEHTCAVTSGGEVWCWGNGRDGRLGNGDEFKRFRPTKVLARAGSTEPLRGIIAVSAGGRHSCALTALGEIKCWGRGSSGQLGNGQTDKQLYPVMVRDGSANLIAGSFSRGYRCLGACALGSVELSPLGEGLSAGSGMDAFPSIGVSGLNLGEVIQIYGDSTCSGTLLGTADAAATSITLTGLSEQTYHLYFKITNGEGGNIWNCSANSLAYTVDSTPPSAPILSNPVAVNNINRNHYNVGGSCRGEDVTIEVNITDSSSTVTYDPVPCLAGRWSTAEKSIVGLNDGTLDITATAFDWVRNSAVTKINVIKDIDSKAVSIDSPGPINFSNQNSYSITGICSHGGETVTVAVGSVTPNTQPTCSAQGVWEVSVNASVIATGNSVEITAQFGSEADLAQDSATAVRDVEKPLVAIEDSSLAAIHWQNARSYPLSGSCSGSQGEIIINVDSAQFFTGTFCPDDGSNWNASVNFFDMVNGPVESFAVTASLDDSVQNRATSSEVTINVISPSFSLARIATATSHSCALTKNGEGRCWGVGEQWRLGNGATSEQTRPVAIKSDSNTKLSDLIQIATKGLFGCALTSEGKVWCWGHPGSLGHGKTSSPLTYAVKAKGPGGSDDLSNIIQITTGSLHACALTGGGEVVCWGDSSDGRLGNGQSTANHFYPVRVQDSTGSGYLDGIVQISGGEAHTCALTNRGEVWCWGDARHGRLGDGQSSSFYSSVESRIRPFKVKGHGGIGHLSGIVQISAGVFHTCTVASGGEVWCWGHGGGERLGHGRSNRNYPYPVKVKMDSNTYLSGIVQVSAGTAHTCAITRDKETRCWGSQGNVGLSGIVQIKAAQSHTCVLTDGGEVKCWGSGANGRLGHGEISDALHPVTVLDDQISDVLSLATGTFERSYHCHPFSSTCTAETIALSLPTTMRSTHSDDAPTLTISGVPEGTTVSLYSDDSCTASINNGETLGDDGVYQYFFKRDREETANCSHSSLSYVLDTTNPATPTIVVSTADPPSSSVTSTDSTPNVTISGVEKGELIRVYRDSSCTTQVGKKRVEGTSVTVTVAPLPGGGTYNFYAKTFDTAGNESSCSMASGDYVYEGTLFVGRSNI